MLSRALKWLSEVEPEFGALSDDEKTEIIDFVLLWSYFEDSQLGNYANMEQIRNYVHQLSDETLDQIELNSLLEYFRDRYVDGDEYTYRYGYLNLEKSGNPAEVEQMLLDKTTSSKDELIGCLGIIYRYRNNLFHGEKWKYRLQEQYDNFRRSNGLLLDILESAHNQS